MIGNLFDNAKFGDMFLTTENKQAVFLRFAENAEYKFAILYVEDWGNVQVFRHNGKEIYNDAAHSIISKQKEPVSEDLEEAATKSANKATPYTRVDIGNGEVCVYTKHVVIDRFKAGANWQKEQMIANTADAMIGLPYENKDGGYTHLIDVSRPLPVGNNKIAIIFKGN